MYDPQVILATDCGGSDEGRYTIAVGRCFFPTRPLISFFETESKNTLHAGFIAAANALSTVDTFGPLKEKEKIGMIVNAAPREGKGNGRKLRGEERKIDGEEIYGVRLDNGVWAVGPNAGMNFYFLKERIKESYLLTDSSEPKTPFRSMEFMVPALANLLDVNLFGNVIVEPKELLVPVPEKGVFVADWDRHGNTYIISTDHDEKWISPLGEAVTVRIGNSVARLRHVDGIFAGHTGEPTLTTGSLKLNGKHVYYIVVVGGDAHGLFKNPPVGSQVRIETC